MSKDKYSAMTLWISMCVSRDFVFDLNDGDCLLRRIV